MEEIVDVNRRVRIDGGSALAFNSMTRGNDCDARIRAKEIMSVRKLNMRCL